MDIKKFLLSCIAFSSLSFGHAFGFEIMVYSDMPLAGRPSINTQGTGQFLNCGAQNKVELLLGKIRTIVNQEKYTQHSEFKAAIEEAEKKPTAFAKVKDGYMKMIGLEPVATLGFLSANKDGLRPYAENLNAKTQLPLEKGMEILEALQVAIKEYMSRNPTQKA
ncbi:MAG: hypothetical protein HRU09_01685 [Oligoflexales bacterium]|nr:hypothetical protein [Oligoflexales bacterium]